MNTQQRQQNPNPNQHQINQKEIKLLKVVFDLPLTWRELPAFRGAMAEWAGFDNTWFHNHSAKDKKPSIDKDQTATIKKDKQGRLFRYPLIQYKVFDGKAGFIAMNDAISGVFELIASGKRDFKMKGQQYRLRIQNMEEKTHLLKVCTDKRYRYSLKTWLGLNQENYIKYHKEEFVIGKIQILQKALTGNILGFCSGMKFYADQYIEVTINDIPGKHTLTNHGTTLQSFDILFNSNLDLPLWPGIGKSAAFGYGRLVHKEEIDTNIKLHNLELFPDEEFFGEDDLDCPDEASI